MTAEIVEDHNIALLQSGNEFVFNIEQKSLAIDRTVEDAWRLNPVAARPQRSMSSSGRKARARRLAFAAPDRRHVGPELGEG